MIASRSLTRVGCDGVNPEVSDVGCVEATGQVRPAPEPQQIEDFGTGVLEVNAEACETAPTPPATIRELEAALRSLGFSRKQAANIALHGFKAAPPEPQSDTQQLSAALTKLRAALQTKETYD
jgi:hypothetical protein